jgi:hypothetical protein
MDVIMAQYPYLCAYILSILNSKSILNMAKLVVIHGIYVLCYSFSLFGNSNHIILNSKHTFLHLIMLFIVNTIDDYT